mgnify:FL=1
MINNFVHGMSKTSTYKSWEAMIQRCSNASLKSYKNYGGRGISVCDEWTKFEKFYADMGIKPNGCSIDHIDVNGNYDQLNCRWSTMKQQNRNRRNNRLIEFNGETMCVNEWAESLGINKRTLLNRLTNGWEIKKALTHPVRQLTSKAV